MAKYYFYYKNGNKNKQNMYIIKMIRSMIKKDVLYINNMNMDNEDEDYDSSLYEYSLYAIPITIALGKPKYDKSEKYNI